MSTSVYVYAVPVNRLRSAPGSKDKALATFPKLKGFFETIDEIAENYEGEEQKPPTCAKAFSQIVNGEPVNDSFRYVYGYAYEGLCMALGAETERSWTQIARSHNWFKEIDSTLALLRIRLKVTDLIQRGPLIDIPRPEDFPSLGWWTAEEVAEAAGAFRVVDLNKLPEKTAKTVADAIDDIRSWIAVAAERPGDWLIGVES
jgi:hypothetical protein